MMEHKSLRSFLQIGCEHIPEICVRKWLQKGIQFSEDWNSCLKFQSQFEYHPRVWPDSDEVGDNLGDQVHIPAQAPPKKKS